MKLTSNSLLGTLCVTCFVLVNAFAASNLTVHSGGTLIVHTNVQVSSGTFSVEPGGALSVDLGSKITAANVVASGTLTVSSNNLLLAAGQTYQLFSAGSYSGAFITVNFPALPAGVTWSNSLSVNGSIAARTVSPGNVQFSTALCSDSNMVLTGSGGTANGLYYVLTTTNLNASAATWTVAATNSFDANGAFIVTNRIDPTLPHQFFIVQAP